MIRGIQRQMIMVKTDKSSIFESACFLLRKDIYEPKPTESDMIKEANRIISENYSHKKRKGFERRKKLRRAVTPFFLGTAFGILSFFLAYFSFLR